MRRRVGIAVWALTAAAVLALYAFAPRLVSDFHARELAQLVLRRIHLVSKHPQRFDRRRDRECVAMAVDDAAAMGGHFDLPRKPRGALPLQEVVLHPLQV